jgi:hypothetical protein
MFYRTLIWKRPSPDAVLTDREGSLLGEKTAKLALLALDMRRAPDYRFRPPGAQSRLRAPQSGRAGLDGRTARVGGSNPLRSLLTTYEWDCLHIQDMSYIAELRMQAAGMCVDGTKSTLRAA